MNKNLWERICFILTETIPSNVSEQIYENKVIRVLQKLGWSQYKKELSVRESMQIGSANRIFPDIIIRNENAGPVCVSEIKKPNVDLNFSGNVNQLSSYIRMPHQLRNFMEFVKLITDKKDPESEIKIYLVTTCDEEYLENNVDAFNNMALS